MDHIGDDGIAVGHFAAAITAPFVRAANGVDVFSQKACAPVCNRHARATRKSTIAVHHRFEWL